MRTYSNSTKAKKPKRNFFKKNVYAIVLGASLLVVALVITLSLTLGNKKPIDNTPPPIIDTDTPPSKIVFNSPLKSSAIKTSAFLDELVWHPTIGQWLTHNGVDFTAAVGEEVMTVAEGKVVSVEDTILEGIVVTISHKDGYVSVYKGLESANVKADDTVSAGGVLGKVGNMMCEQNDGTHLHVELLQSGEFVNLLDHVNVSEDK